MLYLLLDKMGGVYVGQSLPTHQLLKLFQISWLLRSCQSPLLGLMELINQGRGQD